MRIKIGATSVAAAMVAAAAVAVAVVSAGHDAAPDASNPPPARVAPARATATLPAASVGEPGDQACAMNARPATAAGKGVGSPGNGVNGWSRVVSKDKWLDRSSAGALARRASSGDATEARTGAVKVPASTAAAWFGGGDDSRSISPSRCVWVVTVDAPWQMNRHPPFAKAKTFTRYTVSYDAASGQGIDMMAGAGAPDMITGAHASTKSS